MEFLLKNKEFILVIVGIFIGYLIPLAKVNLLGKTIGQKLPKKSREQLADYIDAFEQGLRNKEYRGTKKVISNHQLSQETEKLKVDLGL